jgi:hypothetical protein
LGVAQDLSTPPYLAERQLGLLGVPAVQQGVPLADPTKRSRVDRDLAEVRA